MRLNLKGFQRDFPYKAVGGIIIHNGRCLTEEETRILVNYGVDKGYELADEIPNEIVDEICDTHGGAEWMEKYDDTPEFYTMPAIERVIRKLGNWYHNDWDVDEIIKQIKEEI